MDFNEMSARFEKRKKYPEHSEWISDHLSKYYPEDEIQVFHEIMSLDFHLDVYFIQSQQHNFNILLTAGMSSMEMTVEKSIDIREKLIFAEIMLLIPKDIKFENVATGENENDWIISMLKQTARFPHHYDTWLGIGHTIQATAETTAYDDETNFVAGILLPSVTMKEGFTEIIKDGRQINFYSFFPLYENELNFKLENGYNAFLDLIIEANAREVFNNDRAPLI